MKSSSHGQGLSPEESARRFRALLEAMEDVVIIVGPDGRYRDVAPTRPDLLYRPPEEILGKTSFDIFPREQAELFQQAVEQTMRTGEVVRIEYMLPIAGQELWFEGRLSPILDDEGQSSAVLLVARDITEQQRSRQALREREEQYRTLVEQSNDALYLLFDRRFEFINRRFTEMFGVSPEEVRSPDFDFTSLVAPQSRPLVEERDRKVHQGEPVSPCYEFTALTKDDREIVVEASVAYIPYRGGIATQGIVRDITERKRFEQQLRQRGRYLACLAEIAQDMLRVQDPFAVLSDVLARLGETAQAGRVHIFEAHRDEAGQALLSLRARWQDPRVQQWVDPSTLQNLPWAGRWFERWAEILSQNQMIAGKAQDLPEAERQHLEAQGVQSILVLPLFVGGAWYGFIGFDLCEEAREWEQAEVDLLAAAAHDIAQSIERSQALQALQESEERYRRLIELLPDGVTVHQDGIVRMVNLIGARLLGYNSPEEIIGRPALEFVHPDDHPLVIERIRAQLEQNETAPPLEERFLRKDGTVIPVEVSGTPFTLGGRPASLVVARDVTQRKRLEEQLRQAQKMEAIGRLAGGVAHDFNNLLTAINGYAELLLSGISPDNPLRHEVEAILRAGERAAKLTQQLLAFSRRQVMEMRVVSLNQILEGLATMLRRIIGEDIDLLVRPAANLSNVRVDSAQMEQAVVNLVVNSRDAMPDGGELVLETDNVELDKAYTLDHAEVTPGSYVRLSVSDTGEGIPPEVQKHLFEPFFTTKEGGTGLGLATVYGIIKQFGGHVQVYSEAGQGTTFHLYLPCVEAPLEEAPAPAAEEWPRGVETILVVEDNDMVRNLAVRVLTRQGYAVLEARRGDEALAIAAAYQGTIGLLLTDVVMPQMSGRALVEHLRGGRPEIQVLYMSGYTDNIIAHHGALEPGTPFIQKPFTPQALARKVRATLDLTK